MSELNQKRLIILLLGIATITAGVFTWRAGQIASTAAFEDRTSVGQTIKQEEQNVEINLRAIGNVKSYVQYVADYAEAAALDDRAAELTEVGATALAQAATENARTTRAAASERAAAAGVFGRTSIYADLDSPNPQPRDFDFDTQRQVIASEVTSDISSAGRLDPDQWADLADESRVRSRGLRLGTLIVMFAVVLLTIAEMSDRATTRWIAAGSGLAIFIVASWITMTTVWYLP
jgi:hypothetical protein